MSLSQTYYIASSARAKLGKEACRPDHNLRLLVGHANLLDSLMIELRDAEREQEAWFNASVKQASHSEEPKHIQWVDQMAEDDSDSDSDSDSEFDEEDFEMAMPGRGFRSTPVTVTSRQIQEDEEEMGYEDLEDTPELALMRTSSHPPELVDDSDSEDESSPPTTPPQAVLEFSELDITSSKKQTTSFLQSNDYLITARDPPLIQAY